MFKWDLATLLKGDNDWLRMMDFLQSEQGIVQVKARCCTDYADDKYRIDIQEKSKQAVKRKNGRGKGKS